MNGKEFQELADKQPADVHWGDPLTPEIVRALAQPAQGEAVAWYWEKDGKPVDSEIWRGLPDAEAIRSAEEIGWKPHYLYDDPPATVLLSEHERVKAELADALARLARYEGAEVVELNLNNDACFRLLDAIESVAMLAPGKYVLIPKPDVEV